MEDASKSQDGVGLDRVVFFELIISKYAKIFDFDLSEWQEVKIVRFSWEFQKFSNQILRLIC
jgi:hypothetical protein